MDLWLGLGLTMIDCKSGSLLALTTMDRMSGSLLDSSLAISRDLSLVLVLSRALQETN